MAEKACGGCGMMIEMLKGPSGRWIPAQRVKKFYIRHEDSLIEEYPEQTYKRYVSHFETCPNADDFSGKARKS